MRFALVYRGALSASGNKSKTQEVSEIRKTLSIQMKHLWNHDHALLELKECAYATDKILTDQLFHAPARGKLKRAFERGNSNINCLIEPTRIGQTNYLAFIRSSLHLSCDLNISFLRKDDPGSIITKGGDIDNRLKTLFDSLRLPTESEHLAHPPDADEVFCLLENDSLISSITVSTDRLLLPENNYPNEAHLLIEVVPRVLRIAHYNMCLL